MIRRCGVLAVVAEERAGDGIGGEEGVRGVGGWSVSASVRRGGSCDRRDR